MCWPCEASLCTNKQSQLNVNGIGRAFAQALSDELKQARASLEDGTKDRNRALGIAEEAERHLEDAKLAWRLQTEDLKASLKDALASVVSQEKGGGPCRKEEEKNQQSQTASAIEFPIPRETAVGATGNATLMDDVREPSMRSASDTTSQGLADELLQRLTQETSQRRKSGKALSAKVRYSSDQNTHSATSFSGSTVLGGEMIVIFSRGFAFYEKKLRACNSFAVHDGRCELVENGFCAPCDGDMIILAFPRDVYSCC